MNAYWSKASQHPPLSVGESAGERKFTVCERLRLSQTLGQCQNKRGHPNILSPVIVLSALDIAGGILDAAALGFLGLGAQPPTAEWGAMLSAAKQSLYNAPWLATYPRVAIMVTVLAFNLLGDGLRDALDPHMKL